MRMRPRKDKQQRLSSHPHPHQHSSLESSPRRANSNGHWAIQKPEAVLPAAPRPPSPTDSYYTIAKRAIARAFSLWTRPPGMARGSLARPRTGPSCDSASFSIWRRLAAAARRTIRPSAPKGTLGCPMSPVRITRSRKFQTHILGGGTRRSARGGPHSPWSFRADRRRNLARLWPPSPSAP